MKRAAVILLGMLATPVFAQDSIIYCVEMGRLARDIGKSIEDGLQPSQINFAFPNARADEMEQAEAWAANLKLEVIAAMTETGSADLAAQKIMENCAYQYGAQFKKTGSTDIQSRQQFCWAQIHTYKKLYASIKMEGTETFIAKHPPQNDGVSLDRAMALGAEIEADADPQAWLQNKWDACLSEQKL